MLTVTITHACGATIPVYLFVSDQTRDAQKERKQNA
jgi:hypothetical protein